MVPEYELIIDRFGELDTVTVQASNAAEAWRIGYASYPENIRGVVFLEKKLVRSDEDCYTE